MEMGPFRLKVSVIRWVKPNVASHVLAAVWQLSCDMGVLCLLLLVLCGSGRGVCPLQASESVCAETPPAYCLYLEWQSVAIATLGEQSLAGPTRRLCAQAPKRFHLYLPIGCLLLVSYEPHSNLRSTGLQRPRNGGFSPRVRL